MQDLFPCRMYYLGVGYGTFNAFNGLRSIQWHDTCWDCERKEQHAWGGVYLKRGKRT